MKTKNYSKLDNIVDEIINDLIGYFNPNDPKILGSGYINRSFQFEQFTCSYTLAFHVPCWHTDNFEAFQFRLEVQNEEFYDCKDLPKLLKLADNIMNPVGVKYYYELN